MSFSQDVKLELLGCEAKARHCKIAALCAVVNLCGFYETEKEENNFLVVSSEHESVAELTSSLILDLTGEKYDVTPFDNRPSIVLIGDKALSLLALTGFTEKYSLRAEEPINPLVVASECCARTYLRTAFICCGSVTNPDKSYHFEYVNNDYYHALNIKQLMSRFGIEAKLIERKNHYVVYLKEGEQIADMLKIISATRALMEYENRRIVKDVRNNVNRKVNCETANLNKVVSASVKQRQAIEYIESTVGLDYLSIQLKAAAQARLDYPDLSLKELGEMLKPPVGKSGINHRLKKICEIAQQLKGEN